LIARRKGFAAFEQPIVFDDGQAEKTIEVTLSERPAEEAAAAARRRRLGPIGARPEGVDTAEATEPEAPVTSAKLTITSTPPSNVLLDGKPLGTTPLRDISIEPGSHRVIFIHGAERKSKMIDAEAGSSKTVSETF
jgi:serine/threonine-protein kinase